MKRRTFLASSAALSVSMASGFRVVHANTAQNTSPTLMALVKQYAGAGSITSARVKFDIAPLVENGNSVPIEVRVESPMTTDDHVVGIAVFNEKNPQNDVAIFTLSPAMGRARVATRIRLAISQQLVAVAKMNDGRCFTHTVDVLVTLASCLEEE